jgi:uncharacterized membrane-anchored protein YhcB (DUF1043 family)
MLVKLMDNLKVIVGGLVILIAVGAWIARAEEAHKQAETVEELTKINAKLYQQHKGEHDVEKAKEEERKRIEACLKTANDPRDCF